MGVGCDEENEAKSITVLKTETTGGLTKAFELKIQKNLDIVLHQLQNKKKSRFLLLDIVYINQDNIEKASKWQNWIGSIRERLTSVSLLVRRETTVIWFQAL